MLYEKNKQMPRNNVIISLTTAVETFINVFGFSPDSL